MIDTAQHQDEPTHPLEIVNVNEVDDAGSVGGVGD